MVTQVRKRRTQEERTAETRSALIEATVRVIHRLGYGGASTALIADEAGVSRGAMLHHFGTRAVLMAEVVQWVFEREVEHYVALLTQRKVGNRISDWPVLIWEVLSQPSGLAVLEILLASRSDPDLYERVAPAQAAIEQVALNHPQLAGSRQELLAAGHLIVGAVRGLTITQAVAPDASAIKEAIDLLSHLLERASPSGTISELFC